MDSPIQSGGEQTKWKIIFRIWIKQLDFAVAAGNSAVPFNGYLAMYKENNTQI